MKSLGSAADSRIANIDRVLTSRLPADQADALRAAATTANGVKALEALLQPRGMRTPPPTPRDTEKSVDQELADYYNAPSQGA